MIALCDKNANIAQKLRDVGASFTVRPSPFITGSLDDDDAQGVAKDNETWESKT
jgi:hypothetical protein